MVEKSLEFEPKEKKELVALVIRMNDITKVAQDFESFKQKCLHVTDETMVQRADRVFDDYFRMIIQHINDLADIIGLFILKSEIEQDLLIYFFTLRWKEEGEKLL
jgi:hypothetical protein